MWFFVENRFVEDQAATVSVTDHSFLYGDGCFEGIGVCDGKILHLDEHVNRLFHSCRMLRLDLQHSKDEVRSLILETAKRNGMDTSPFGYLRPLVSRGAGPLGLKWSIGLGPAKLYVIPQLGQRRISYMGEMETLTAATTSMTRATPSSLDPRVKSNNYLTSILAFLDAQDRGADIAILRDEKGFISEGHAMNLFCIKDGALRAPHTSVALAGITRANVMPIARELGYECTETLLTLYDLVNADEAFITSSLEGVAAISSIDGNSLRPPVPGPITESVRGAYTNAALEAGTPVARDK